MRRLLEQHEGKSMVIGTHGNIMVLMMKEFDAPHDLSFWKQLSMPYVYKLTFEKENLIEVERMWRTPKMDLQSSI